MLQKINLLLQKIRIQENLILLRKENKKHKLHKKLQKKQLKKQLKKLLKKE